MIDRHLAAAGVIVRERSVSVLNTLDAF